MKLNKKMQYGLLLCLYISRGGRVTLDAASENLKISLMFLEQIARQLRLKGILKSVRGPGGGYELENNATTVLEVIVALGYAAIVDNEDLNDMIKGEQEHRTFVNYVNSIKQALKPVLNRKIANLCNEYAINEMSLLNKPSPSATRN